MPDHTMPIAKRRDNFGQALHQVWIAKPGDDDHHQPPASTSVNRAANMTDSRMPQAAISPMHGNDHRHQHRLRYVDSSRM